MAREELIGILILALGLGSFGFILSLRARRLGAPGSAGRGSLRALKALASPSREWTAAVVTGPPFEDRIDSAIESALWFLIWLFPAPLCRMEVWIWKTQPSPGGEPEPLERLSRRPPVLKELIWRGMGSPEQGTAVELSWIGPRALEARYRGTTRRIEV